MGSGKIAGGKLWAWWALVGAWIVLACWISLTPSPPGNDLLIALSKHFPSPQKALRAMQGILHVGLYGIGALLLASAISSTRPAIASPILFGSVVGSLLLFGAVIEYLQDYVPQRRADIWDLLGDLAGAVVFLGAARLAAVGPFSALRRKGR